MAEFWREEIDLALTEGYRGKTIVHRMDCPKVQAARVGGRMIFNMLGCKGIPEGVNRCDCLEKE